MKISVIIPAYNQDELVKCHVRFCMASSEAPYEIIVVNDGGNDSLKSELLTIRSNIRLIYAKIKEDKKWNQVGARNLGVWLSTGELLAIEDADHLPDASFYQLAKEQIEKRSVDMVLARKRISVRLDDLKANKLVPIGTRGTHKLVSLMQRKAYLKMKGFDESFANHYGWDVPDWRRRFARNGLTVAQAGIYYHVEDGKTNIERRVDANGVRYPEASNYQILKSNDRSERKQPQGGILNFDYEFERLI